MLRRSAELSENREAAGWLLICKMGMAILVRRRKPPGRRQGLKTKCLKGLRMSRVTTLNSPFLLGFGDMERALDRASRTPVDGYPPYNIERLPKGDNLPERLRVTLAVAGFTSEQLEITLEEHQLVIRGRQHDDAERQYLHRGIAARHFQRAFLLAEGMQVLGANLDNGLLSVDLARPEPERVIRKINISVRD